MNRANLATHNRQAATRGLTDQLDQDQPDDESSDGRRDLLVE